MSERAEAYRKLADEEDNITDVEEEITRIKETIDKEWLQLQPVRRLCYFC